MIKIKEWKQISEYLKYAKKYRKKILILYISAIGSNIINLFPIYFMGNIINYAVSKQFDNIINTIFLMLIFYVVSTVLSAAETYFSNVLVNSIANDLKESIFNKFTKMTISNISEMGIGNFISVIENDTSAISNFFIGNILEAILSFSTAIVSLFFLIKLSNELTFIAICFIPVIYIGYAIFGKYIKRVSFLLKQKKDCNMTYINLKYENIKEIKNCCIEDAACGKYSNMIADILKNVIKYSNISMASAIFGMTISSVSEWTIIAVGCWEIINGNLMIGNYVSFNGYLQKFMTAVNGLLNINIILQNVVVSSERITRVMKMNEEDYESGSVIQKVEGNIEIDNISCGYNSLNNVIQNLSIKFRKNDIYVIVGTNGSGKTTFFNAIMRFIDINAGKILIDGSDIMDINLHSLRSNIAYVQQGNPSFDGSIKEIFCEVNPTITEQEVAELCALVGISNLIETLPEKYDTVIGREGISLSGGEYRKILIAKSLARKSKILLLDEITSDLDGKAEKEVMEVLKELAHNHTVILISHRASSIVTIPNICVMDNGRIIATGSHDELLSSCKKYKILVENQLGD